jgi:recombination protein RecA
MKKKTTKDAQESSIVDKINAKFGAGTVLESDADDDTNVTATSTGCIGLDEVFGCGGLPHGRIIEIYGAESSGKTTMTLFIAAQLQRQGKKIAFVDVEQAFDKSWARKLGVEVEKMIVTQPSTVEDTLEIVRTLAQSNEFAMIIVDSVEAMIPKKELEEGALEKDSIGLKARLLNKYLRVLTSEAAKTQTAIVFINQVRANVGVLYGPKDITPGGKALKFYASVRLSVSKGDAIKNGTEHIGNSVKVVAKKNKVGFPFREAELDLYYESGIDLAKDLLAFAEKNGVIIKEGNTYIYENEKIGTSKEKATSYLREHQDVYERIFTQLRQKPKGASD